MEPESTPTGTLISLKLTNFKCHKDTSDVQLSPITLLVGPNSSGKTAFIEPLLLIKQTLEPSASAINPITLSGSYTDSGAFSDVINEHNSSLSLKMKLGVEIRLSPSIKERVLPAPVLKRLGKVTEIPVSWSIKIGYSKEQQRMILSEMELDGTDFKLKLDLTEMSCQGKIFGRHLKAPLKEETGKTLLAQKSLRDITNTLPFVLLESARPRKGSLSMDEYFYLRVVTTGLVSLFERLQFIGPIREYPLRYYQVSGGRVPNVGIDGENAIPLLKDDELMGGNLMKEVKKWLNKLNVADGLQIKPVDPNLFSLLILSPFTKTPVNITDSGFGVSQIIPIIVQSYMMPRNGTLILEQPEIHLHPRAQSILADLLVDLANKGRRFIVETHSEHVILRLQRCVAEKKINPDKIRVYYFDQTEGGVTIRSIKVDSRGQLLDFPRGFMEEGLEEAYGIAMARASRPSGED